MKIVVAAGARPNFVKVAPIMRALAGARAAGAAIDALLVDTGQHYDDAMSAALFRDLNIPQPARCLGVGSGTHAAQTAAILAGFEAVLLDERPDAVVVVGDVNSTLACALAAAKLGVRVAHVEAGLRSFDPSMPEEINRRLTDAVSDFLFTTEASANHNLRREGVAPDTIFFVGNVMVDSLRWALRAARPSRILSQLTMQNGARAAGFAVVTLHRPSNVDDPRTFRGLLDAIARTANELPVLFPAHPRTRARLEQFGVRAAFQRVTLGADPIALQRGCVYLLDALPYVDCLQLLSTARLVLTDSGGVQEETTSLGVPCVTLRDTTERPITVTAGTNVIAGTNPENVLQHARRALADGTRSCATPPLWDGQAAQRIVDILIDRL